MPSIINNVYKEWTDEFTAAMVNTRSSDYSSDEFKALQDVYTKFSKDYDNNVSQDQYTGPPRLADKIASLYPEEKEIKILDFGCGTGLVADALSVKGFTNIDGTDCNQGLLDVAESKGIIKKLIFSKDADGLKEIPSDSYDLVCSSGCFFLSSTHPTMSCIPDLVRIIRPGGYLVILTKNIYLSFDYVDFSIIDKLEKKNIIKSFPKETFPGYRKPFEFESDNKSMGAILKYKVL